MLPRTKDHNMYYVYLGFALCLAGSIAVLIQYVYVDWVFNRSMFSLGYLVFTYNVITQLRYESVTFWVDVVTLVTFLGILGYLQKKNNYKRVIQYSRFARWNDIKNMNPSVLKEDGFALGSFNKKILKTNEPLGLLCVAPAGAGKTSGTVVPCILEADKDSLIINDPKGELYDLTHKYRRSLGGKVFRIEWGQDKNKQDSLTTKWNPIALSNMPEDTAGRSKYVEMIVNILIKQSGGDAFWANSGRKTLGAVMLYLIYKNELENKDATIAQCKDTLATIGVLSEKDQEEVGQSDPTQYGFKRLMNETQELEIPEVIKHRCYTVFAELGSTSANTLGSILATVSSDLSVFNNENVIDVTSSNNFSMKQLRGEIKEEGKKKKHIPNTIYLISPASEQELFGVLSAIFVEVAYKYITSEDLKEVKKSNIVRFILDGVAFFPKISATIDGPAIARGYKGSFLFVCQDLGQIKDKFTDNGLNTMFTNSAFKIVLPQNNDETARRFANLGGTTEISEWENNGSGKKIRRKKQKPLLEASDILHLPEGKQIVFTQNNAKTPIMCDIPFFFKDTNMMKKLKQADKWYAQNKDKFTDNEVKNAEEMKAIASGNPYMLLSIKLHDDLNKAKRQLLSDERNQKIMQTQLQDFENGTHTQYNNTNRAIDIASKVLSNQVQAKFKIESNLNKTTITEENTGLVIYRKPLMLTHEQAQKRIDKFPKKLQEYLETNMQENEKIQNNIASIKVLLKKPIDKSKVENLEKISQQCDNALYNFDKDKQDIKHKPFIPTIKRYEKDIQHIKNTWQKIGIKQVEKQAIYDVDL